MTLNLAAAQEQAVKAMAQFDLPGLAMAVIHRDEPVFTGGWGHWDSEAKYAIDSNTVFGVASLTKLVTAAVILHLQARGLLSINDPIDKYFPVLAGKAAQPILLRHLLSHAGGFPGLPFRFHAADTGGNSRTPGSNPGGQAPVPPPGSGTSAPPAARLFNANELASAIADYPVQWLGKPGERLNYSNEGFCLLGGVAEQVSGQPYGLLAQEIVFNPLGMTRSGIGTPNPAADHDGNIALPLVRANGRTQNVPFWQAPLFYAAGGATATAGDVARLVHMLSESAPVLGPDQRRIVMTPAMSVASRPQPTIGYGLGLETRRIDSHTNMFWHTGQRAGIASFMAWLPEERLATSVLSNVSDAPVARIGHSMIATMLKRNDINWPPAIAEEKLPDDRAGQPASEKWCTDYRTAEGNFARVDRQNGQLVLRRQPDGCWRSLRFADATSGVVGDETFRFLDDDSLALDLRILPRVNSTSTGSKSD